MATVEKLKYQDQLGWRVAVDKATDRGLIPHRARLTGRDHERRVAMSYRIPGWWEGKLSGVIPSGTLSLFGGPGKRGKEYTVYPAALGLSHTHLIYC